MQEMQVLEQFTAGKKNDDSLNEDTISVSRHFKAVFDGSSSYHPGVPKTMDGMPNGCFASRALAARLPHLDPGITAGEAIEDLTAHLRAAVREAAAKEGTVFTDLMAYPMSTMLVYSERRNEIWRVCDSPFALFGGDGSRAQTGGTFPQIGIWAEVRRMYLEAVALDKGLSEQEMAAEDPSAGVMGPLIVGGAAFVNYDGPQWLHAGAHCADLVAGRAVPDDFLRIDPALDAARGISGDPARYINLFNTVARTEEYVRGVFAERKKDMRGRPSLFGVYDAQGSVALPQDSIWTDLRRFYAAALAVEKNGPPAPDTRDANCVEAGIYGFGVVNGKNVPARYIEVHAVAPDTRKVALGSDGYPELFATQAATEAFLQDMISADPLMARNPYRHVRGLQAPGGSFDDRALLVLARKNGPKFT